MSRGKGLGGKVRGLRGQGGRSRHPRQIGLAEGGAFHQTLLRDFVSLCSFSVWEGIFIICYRTGRPWLLFWSLC